VEPLTALAVVNEDLRPDALTLQRRTAVATGVLLEPSRFASGVARIVLYYLEDVANEAVVRVRRTLT
jgi:hypothetical protein